MDRWAGDGLGVYDRVRRAERVSTASAEGWVKNFIRVEKATSEQRWQSEVEDHLGKVFSALDVQIESILDEQILEGGG